jgi:hypothetical protein
MTPAHQQPPPVAAAPTFSSHPKSKLPIWIVLGVIALGGAGVGVWFATREKAEAKKDPWDTPTPVENKDEPDKDEPDTDEHDDGEKPDTWDTPPPKQDPWGPQGSAPTNITPAHDTPKKKTIGTAATGIPAGAKLRVGSGFKSNLTVKAHVYINADEGIVIALAPLDAGTNDPAALGKKWSQQTGVTPTGSMKLTSAGKLRPALGFVGQVNGTPVNQIVVLYIEPEYRLGVLYQAPSASFEDEDFQQDVTAWFAKNVVLP